MRWFILSCVVTLLIIYFAPEAQQVANWFRARINKKYQNIEETENEDESH